MRYLTDKQADSTPSLTGLDDDQRAQVLTDAAAIYGYAGRSRGTLDDGKLRKWGEQHAVGPDRMNAALAFLADTGRLLAVPDDALLNDQP